MPIVWYRFGRKRETSLPPLVIKAAYIYWFASRWKSYADLWFRISWCWPALCCLYETKREKRGQPFLVGNRSNFLCPVKKEKNWCFMFFRIGKVFSNKKTEGMNFLLSYGRSHRNVFCVEIYSIFDEEGERARRHKDRNIIHIFPPSLFLAGNRKSFIFLLTFSGTFPLSKRWTVNWLQ